MADVPHVVPVRPFVYHGRSMGNPGPSRIVPPVNMALSTAHGVLRDWVSRLGGVFNEDDARLALREAAYEVGGHLKLLDREKAARDLWAPVHRASGMPQAEAERIVAECFAAAEADLPPPQTPMERRLSNLTPWGPHNPPPRSPGRP